ncbi:cytochrome c biogenesis CcdA family protein [Chloroflexota bacterium]
MDSNISIYIAFGAGVLSFLSPCVIPMVPVFLAAIAGESVLVAGNPMRARFAVLGQTAAFVSGFSLIFIGLGAIAGLTGYAINPSAVGLRIVAGMLLIAFGIYMLVAMIIPKLNIEKRFNFRTSGRAGLWRSLGIGAAFSLGWTACVTPILGGILSIASVQSTALKGAGLLAAYSLGLGLPFLVFSITLDYTRPLLTKIARYSKWYQASGGLLLLIAGVLLLLNKLTIISQIGG